jgi:hypothetical protein
MCPALVFALLALPAARAAIYTAPSGYLQIVGYKLQRGGHDGQPELAVEGWVEALADCSGATLLFDVLDRDGNPVGTLKISHGAFFRHDRWELGPGVFTPQDRAATAAMNAADHVMVREADCN